MPLRTLTERVLNRSLLERQLLLERSSLSVPEAVEQVGCLQAQYAPSGDVGQPREAGLPLRPAPGAGAGGGPPGRGPP